MKRGVSNHLDWVMAFGLFFVAVTFIIVSLKPGVSPTHEPEVLAKIVEDNFHDNFNWKLEKLPMRLTTHGPIVKCTNFLFPSWTTSKLFKETESGFNEILVNVGSDLILGASELVETNTYFLIRGEGLSSNGISCSSDCSACEGFYGVPYELEGISCDKLGNAQPIDYESIKSEWNYPNTRDFSLSMTGSCNVIINNVEPPINSPVYVRTINDYILKDNGEREIVSISIKVW